MVALDKPLAAVSAEVETSWHDLERSGTVGESLRVDSLASLSSAFGHGDAEAAVQLTRKRGAHCVPQGCHAAWTRRSREAWTARRSCLASGADGCAASMPGAPTVRRDRIDKSPHEGVQVARCPREAQAGILGAGEQVEQADAAR